MEQQQFKTEEPEAPRFLQQRLQYPNQPLAIASANPQIATENSLQPNYGYSQKTNQGCQHHYINYYPTVECQGHMNEPGERPSNNITTVVMTVSKVNI